MTILILHLLGQYLKIICPFFGSLAPLVVLDYVMIILSHP